MANDFQEVIHLGADRPITDTFSEGVHKATVH